MDKLTTSEIEKRIEQFELRAAALEEFINDIKDENAKVTLYTHINSYATTLKDLRKELSKRNKNLPADT